MPCYTTKSSIPSYSYREAVFENIRPDGALFLPYAEEKLTEAWLNSLSDKSIQEIAFDICRYFLKKEIDNKDLLSLTERAFSFDAPLIYLDEGLAVLELFHGPTYAFKDFGARFLAELMMAFRPDHKEVKILVATSGDTGGAVASGFYNKPGFSVYILYPEGKVSPFQLSQMQQYQGNIHCFPVRGTFDDCQQFIKQALSDQQLQSRYMLSTANSINVARLIAQAIYYFRAVAQLHRNTPACSFYVPSGNLGNASSCMLAASLGLSVRELHICQNSNNPMATYLQTGIYTGRPALPTLSNAMDVGYPNNFERVIHYTGSTWNNSMTRLSGHTISDQTTMDTIVRYNELYHYLMDPHTAVAAAPALLSDHCRTNIILGTAHWIKFRDQFDYYTSHPQPAGFPSPPSPSNIPSANPIRNYSEFYDILVSV